nr:IS200/IS605 family accessory protein TnpB-related protein [Ktedonospora formicarum]
MAEGIGTLVIGRNVGWKQEINLGKRTNQNFVQVPHARFIEMLTYKAEQKGIRVILTEESYTSQASFLDRDPLPTYQQNQEHAPVFSGKRITRRLYRASNGQLIHADCNGSYNIIRKAAPDAFGSEGVEDGECRVHLPVVHPVVRPERRAIFCSVQTEPHSGNVSKAAPYLDPKGKSGKEHGAKSPLKLWYQGQKMGSQVVHGQG